MNRSKEEADFEHSLVQDLALSAIIADATSHTPTTLRASAIRHPAHRGRQGVADGAEQEVVNKLQAPPTRRRTYCNRLRKPESVEATPSGRICEADGGRRAEREDHSRVALV
ncbi:hypothetical protein AAT19DRAFT_9334 [Rhodotorula toruloides]|uniref:Uncharacterized protein n=1 Tax=Rhodotorula toruloides TaxID=5286 RepID=A0A2T0A1X4_RHOTO|nr:hypothetical protein AAT19DRAFT_9334 [Rhodotorula toruloides]